VAPCDHRQRGHEENNQLPTQLPERDGIELGRKLSLKLARRRALQLQIYRKSVTRVISDAGDACVTADDGPRAECDFAR
jgi:hypothetical protein